MRLRLFLQSAVLIYQMPKAGSQTIEATLQSRISPARLLRFHYLSPELAETIRKGLTFEHATESWRREARSQLRLMQEVGAALRWRKFLCRCGLRLPKLQVITGVREPIAVALSAMFENYAVAFPEPEAALTACRDALLHPKTMKYIQEWFDLELKPMLGLDVYEQPFDYRRGYGIYENRFARFLVYRFEALSKLPIMLRQFLGLTVHSIENRNIGAAKQYGELYRYVRDHLRLPTQHVATQYRSRMMRHFYSPVERGQFYERWAEETVPVSTAVA